MKMMNPGIRLCAYLIGSASLGVFTSACGFMEHVCSYAMCEDNESPGFDQPGLLVECAPGEMDPELLCMNQVDWDCDISKTQYTREALCAFRYGGSPSSYNNKPKLVKDAVGDSPMVDCSGHPDSVWDHTVSDFGSPGLNDCSSCTMCDLQRAGAQYFGVGSWSELNGTVYCPDNEYPPECGFETPTTGADDEGGTGDTGGEPTTGEEADVMWACNGSNLLTGCLNGVDLECTEGMARIMGNNKTRVVCVPSAPGDVSAAKQACYNRCNDYNIDYNMDGDWDPEFECALFTVIPEDEEYIPIEVPAGDEWKVCVQYEASSQAMPFDGEVSLDIVDGATTVANVTSIDWKVMIDFAIVGTCTSATTLCDVTITGIYATGTDLSAIYDDGSPTPSPSFVTIRSPHLRLMQPVMGVMNPSTGAMSFPNHDLFLDISTGPTYLGSTEVSGAVSDFIVFVDNPTGSYVYSTGQVELSLAWSVGDVSVSMDLASW